MMKHIGWLVLISTVVAVNADTASAEKAPPSYSRDIQPILAANCVGCHQPAKASGAYVMTAFDRLLAGGDRGEPAIVPGKPDESLLVKLITAVDGEAEMPMGGKPLHESEVEKIREWIAAGAVDDLPADRVVIDAENPPVYTQPPVVNAIDHSPDGELLAIAGYHEVRLHNAADGKLVGRLVGLSERVEAVRFSPDGKSLAAVGGNPGRSGEVQVWDVADQGLLLSVPVGYDTNRGVSWSPDGETIAFGCADNTVRVINADSGEQVLFQAAPNDWALDTVFSVDGSHLVAVGRDMTAKLIEVKTERFIDNITSITPGALKGGINSVARRPGRDEIVYGGADGVPRLYQMHRTTKRVIGDDANLLLELPPLEGRIFGVDFSADGALIAAGSSLDGHGEVHVYRIDPEFDPPKEIKALLEKPTHTRSGDEVKKLKKFFADSVEVTAEIKVPDSAVYAVSLSPDGKTLAAAGSDGVIRIVDTSSGEVAKRFDAVTLEESTEKVLASTDRASSSASLPTESVDEPSLPTDVPIENLTVEPSLLHLPSGSGPTQLVVTAEMSDGRRFDVTRTVEVTLDNEIAEADAFGRLHPHEGGTASVSIRHGDASVEVPLAVWEPLDKPSPDYVQDVSPILARAGCNQGTCHGAQDGKNGFKLSLRGYDALFDVRALTDDHASRRVNRASPDNSLMLLKATARVPHEGGQRIEPGSRWHRVLRAWIESGAELDRQSPKVASITVSPDNPVVEQIGGLQQVRITAHYADGATRDVTSDAFIESGNTDVVAPVAEHAGLMRALRRGESPVLVRYEGAYAATTLTVMGDRTGFAWRDAASNSRIDELVAAKLKRTKTSPAPLADEYAFVRRVHLDLTGLPPTPDAIRAFIEDERPSQEKRDALIDKLIGSDDFIDHWTNKWADLLQVNGKFLGREGATAFRNWIREEVAGNTPYDEFSRKILTASGSNRENPAASYFKTLRTPQDTMENTTHLFLSTRFNCNKCHDHPFERWTQDQYYEMAAFFAQVELKKDPKAGGKMIGGSAVERGQPLYEVVLDKSEGEIKHDRTGAVTAPDFPFDCDHDCGDGATRRERLASWITSPDNPYFARSYVNRLWGYLLGTGIIEPIDDLRAGNPPTNPELLDYLTDQFIESGFDARHVMRMICQSATYQRSVKSDHWNRDDTLNFSHAKARRLPAEVLYDAVHRATGSVSNFPGVPAGTRAAELPDAGIKLPDGFLDNLGRPARESSCECERVNEMQLGPVMALVSGPTVGDAISDPSNKIAKLANSDLPDNKLVEEIYLRVLNRPPTTDEVTAAQSVFAQIEADHKDLVTSRDQHADGLLAELAKRELARQRDVIRLDAALAARIAEIAPERKRLEAERAKRIAKADAEVKSREKELTKGLVEWEQSLVSSGSNWKVLAPEKLATNIKGELVAEADGAVFADVKPGRGHYRVTGPADGSRITAIRLEALLDDRLDSGGPGRAPNGNLVLTEIIAYVVPADGSAAEETEIKLTNAKADFNQGGYEIKKAIDGSVNDRLNGWAISPELDKSHVATFELAEPITLGEGQRLMINLEQQYTDEKHQLGRFRLATTDADTPVDFGLPAEIESIVRTAQDSRTAAQIKALTEYRGEKDERLAELRAALAKASEPVPKDPKQRSLENQLAAAKKPLPIDPKLRRLERDVAQSEKQAKNYRLTAAQDLTWALINSPAFLYNH